MNKFAIAFFLNYYDNPDKNKNYYLMLYYALETLLSKLGNNINIYICYDITKNVPEKFNIFQDFNEFSFIEIKYPIKENYQRMFYKWYCVDYLFQNEIHEQFLILDVDVIFKEDPIFIFNKYNNLNKFYCINEKENLEIKKIINAKKAINGGQVLISNEIYNKIKNIHENLLFEREILEKKSRKLSNYYYNWIMNDLSDQYCLTNLLYKLNIEIDFFDLKDICFGINCPDSKIFHYFSSLSNNYLPEKFINKD
jgi:hypothetical protein